MTSGGETMEIKGKVAVITGGSRGIGKATALELSKKGAKIALIYNASLEKAREIENEIKSNGGTCKIYKCDVSNFEEVSKVVSEILNDFGKIDILVNNSGIAIKESITEALEENWDKTIDVNLKGMFNMCRFIVPEMLKNGSGKIVNVSSLAGRNGGTLGVAYAASKAGAIGLTQALAAELTPKGVLVNAVAPGPVYTDLVANLPEEALKNLEKLSPVGRFAHPEEIAHAIIFLIENDYVSGEVVNINAGRYMN